MTLDRNHVLNEADYQFDKNKKKSDHTSKKSWWIIGILIALSMNFVAFFIFHFFHIKQHSLKNLYL